MTILSPTYTLNDLHRLSRELQRGNWTDGDSALVAWAAGLIEAVGWTVDKRYITVAAPVDEEKYVLREAYNTVYGEADQLRDRLKELGDELKQAQHVIKDLQEKRTSQMRTITNLQEQIQSIRKAAGFQ